MSTTTAAKLVTPPWGGLGKTVTGLKTSKEALEAGGLNWTVEKQQLYFGDNFDIVHDQFANVRMTDKKVLGLVSEGYHIFQNEEAFSFLDQIADNGTGDAQYMTVGSSAGGKRVFLTMKLGNGFMVGDQDAHDLYLLVTNSHDATQALTAAVTPIRVACTNAVTMSLRKAKSKWTLRHKTALAGKVQEARESLEMSYHYADEFQKQVDELMKIEVTKDTFLEIVEGIVPESKFKHEKEVAELMAVFENEETVRMGGGEGNGWGAFNAVTYFTDHVREYRTSESRFNSLMDLGGPKGYGDKLRNDAMNRILALS